MLIKLYSDEKGSFSKNYEKKKLKNLCIHTQKEQSNLAAECQQ